MAKRSTFFRLTPLRIAVIYLTLASSWIVFTDLLVEGSRWWRTTEHQLQTAKGLAFVGITTLCLYWLVRRFRRIVLREQALQELMELYSRNGADLVFSLNRNGSFFMISSSCTRQWGYSENEVLHKPAGMFLYGEDGTSLHLPDLRKLADVGKVAGIRVLKKDKNHALLDCVVEKWHGDQLLWVCRDVTETRTYMNQLINSEKRYRVLFDATPIATWLCNANTLAFVDVNEATVRQYGYSRQELLQMTLADIRPNDDLSDIHKRIKSYFQDYNPRKFREELSNQVWKHRHKNGSTVYVRVAAEPIQLDGQQFVMVQAQNITHLMELESKYQVLLLNAQRDLYMAGIEAQEQERQRIAEDLHDSVGQLLAGVFMGLNMAHDAAANQKYEENLKHLHSAQELLELGIQELRAVTRSITPSTLNQLGLVPAIDKLVQQSRLVTHSTVLFHHQYVGEVSIPSVIEIMVYRLAQELLNNSLKHAKAEVISLHLFLSPEAVHLQVEDNGSGFDFGNAFQKGMGMGLQNITRRVEAMGGHIEFISHPSVGGSTIHARLPLASATPVPSSKLL
ncbi:MAG: PAS domain S-box protein [Bacteroidetes bacterium]|nr:PAS domain S-box protein [Bacteroidota bacterium]